MKRNVLDFIGDASGHAGRLREVIDSITEFSAAGNPFSAALAIIDPADNGLVDVAEAAEARWAQAARNKA
ncbi:MAG: hypothetical protein KF708_04050 [Pirellulales bacterium]|nr:hypothetical protein [Pirellulales bacterium]